MDDYGRDFPGITFHGFQGPGTTHAEGKIDWILVRGALDVRDAEVIEDGADGRYPSDHYFMGATLALKSAR